MSVPPHFYVQKGLQASLSDEYNVVPYRRDIKHALHKTFPRCFTSGSLHKILLH